MEDEDMIRVMKEYKDQIASMSKNDDEKIAEISERYENQIERLGNILQTAGIVAASTVVACVAYILFLLL